MPTTETMANVEGPPPHQRERQSEHDRTQKRDDGKRNPDVRRREEQAVHAACNDFQRTHHDERVEQHQRGRQREQETRRPAQLLGPVRLQLGPHSPSFRVRALEALLIIGCAAVERVHRFLDVLSLVLVDAEDSEQVLAHAAPDDAEHGGKRHRNASQRLDGVGHDRGVDVGVGRRREPEHQDAGDQSRKRPVAHHEAGA